jgi:hypothetical protein
MPVRSGQWLLIAPDCLTHFMLMLFSYEIYLRTPRLTP